MIPYGKQAISQQDIDAVVDVLKSDWLTQGPKVPAFEQAIAKYCGSTYACATNSATSALHIACLYPTIVSRCLVLRQSVHQPRHRRIAMADRSHLKIALALRRGA